MDDVIRELITLADGDAPIECVLKCASALRWQARAYPRGIITFRYVDGSEAWEVWEVWLFTQSKPRLALVTTLIVAGKRLSAEKWIGEWRRYQGTIPGDVYDAMADIYH
jgi:hypothetical protein